MVNRDPISILGIGERAYHLRKYEFDEIVNLVKNNGYIEIKGTTRRERDMAITILGTKLETVVSKSSSNGYSVNLALNCI